MKLTIAFPTYNRALYLERAVDSVARQLGEIARSISVELRVLDNASTDETPAICERLRLRYPGIEIFRETNNTGGNANILRALKEADGDYVWVFGDDDCLLPGAMRHISSYLANGDLELLHFGSIEERDNRSGEEARLPPTLLDSLPSVPESVEILEYSSADCILQNIGLGMGQFSSSIFSTSFFRTSYATPDDELFESGYSQIEWIYRGLFQAFARFAHSVTPMLSVRIEMAPRGTSDERVAIGMDILRSRLLALGYGRSSVDELYSRQIEAIRIGRVKNCKLNRQPILSAALRALRETKSVRTWMKVLIIAILPGFVYRNLWVRLGAR